jgi:hypothetical protein
MIPPYIKDALEVMDNVVIIVSFLGLIAGGLHWYVTKKKKGEAGDRAIEQINHMATNCVPTIQRNGTETNKHLEEQTPLLREIATGITILVDRTSR